MAIWLEMRWKRGTQHIEFIDQLRDVLVQNDGDDIKTFLQEVMPPPETWIGEEDDEVF